MWRKFIPITLAAISRLPAQESPADVSAMLEPIRQEFGLPALTAAAIIDGRIVSQGAAGMRTQGGSKTATSSDLWHIGSCTKSMTATVAAMMVEDGKLRWDSKIADAIPALGKVMHEDWKNVTLEQLLTHRSGAPADDAPKDLWKAARAEKGTPAGQRLAFARGLVSRPTEAPPETKFIYSNQGYAIAGAMMETVAGEPFEKLMTSRLFKPLGLDSAGFGAPGKNQPWGHRRAGNEIQPVPPGPGADNPPAIAPAGRVHLSIGDFARYAGWHASGIPPLLSAASLSKLHTAADGQDYAFGWGVGERGWAGGTTLSHSGSNTMWFAVMWVAPERKAAFVAATNIAGDDATKGTDAAVAALIRKHLR